MCRGIKLLFVTKHHYRQDSIPRVCFLLGCIHGPGFQGKRDGPGPEAVARGSEPLCPDKAAENETAVCRFRRRHFTVSTVLYGDQWTQAVNKNETVSARLYLAVKQIPVLCCSYATLSTQRSRNKQGADSSLCTEKPRGSCHPEQGSAPRGPETGRSGSRVWREAGNLTHFPFKQVFKEQFPRKCRYQWEQATGRGEASRTFL